MADVTYRVLTPDNPDAVWWGFDIMGRLRPSQVRNGAWRERKEFNEIAILAVGFAEKE